MKLFNILRQQDHDLYCVDTKCTERHQCFVQKMSVSNMSIIKSAIITFSVVVLLLAYVFTFNIKVEIQTKASGILSEGTLLFLQVPVSDSCFEPEVVVPSVRYSGSRGTHLHRALIYSLIMRVSQLDQDATIHHLNKMLERDFSN